jgi:starch phosphorylase
LYTILENQLTPEFYTRNAQGIPERWVQRIRRSMSTLTPQFSANRTVREYTEKYYLPAAANYLQRAADNGAAGIRIVNANRQLKEKWGGLRLGDLQSTHTGDGWSFRISADLNGIDAAKVAIELYADSKTEEAPERIVMQPENGVYQAAVKTDRPDTDYTARIIPAYENIAMPLEDHQIHWQR